MVKRVCFGCKSGYKSCSDKVRFFIVPKDENTIILRQIAILRYDMKLKAGHAICEKHFKPEDIFQETLTHAPYGVKVYIYIYIVIIFLIDGCNLEHTHAVSHTD